MGTTDGGGRDDPPIEAQIGDRKDVELMYRFYTDLRDEINQSIEFQNRIVIGGGAFIAAAYGLQFSGILGELAIQNPVLKLVVAVLPTVVVFTISLWIIEQSRMMRAGHYLHFLENKINAELDGVYLTWENWLRGSNTPIYHQTHRIGQLIGYALFLYGLAVVALAVYAIEILGVTTETLATGTFEWATPAFAYFVLNSVLLVYLARYTYLIVFHDLSDESTFEGFKQWETEYCREYVTGFAYQSEIEERVRNGDTESEGEPVGRTSDT